MRSSDEHPITSKFLHGGKFVKKVVDTVTDKFRTGWFHLFNLMFDYSTFEWQKENRSICNRFSVMKTEL